MFGGGRTFRPKSLEGKTDDVKSDLLNPLCRDMQLSNHPSFFLNGKPPRRRKRKLTEKQKKKQKMIWRQKMAQIFRLYRPEEGDVVRSDRYTSSPPFPIDVVFTWVQSTPEHQEKMDMYSTATTFSASSNPSSSIPTDNGHNRYAENEELRYAIRSIYANAPYIRKIFLVVDDDQVPYWLTPDCASAPIPVVVVPHSLIFKGAVYQEHLPTFNSQSIESHLHEIGETLSEHFIYFNDDMFIGEPSPWSHFFSEDGKPKYTLLGVIPRGPKHPNMNKHMMAWINNGIALDKTFPQTSGSARRFPSHQCIPMVKSSFTEVWENPLMKRYLNITSRSRFREINNLYLIGYLCYWNIYNQKAAKTNLSSFFIQVTDVSDVFAIAQQILKTSPIQICINDGLDKRREDKGYQIRLLLSYLFPKPTPVEGCPDSQISKVPASGNAATNTTTITTQTGKKKTASHLNIFGQNRNSSRRVGLSLSTK